MRKAIYSTLCLAALVTCVQAETQPVLIGENFRISAGLTDNLAAPYGAYNSVAGEFRVVWFDSRVVGQNDVYAQRVGTDGALQGSNVTIISAPWTHNDPCIAYNPVANNYLVTWYYQGELPETPNFNHTFGGLADAVGGLTSPIGDYSMAAFEPTLIYNPAHDEYLFFARAHMPYGGGPGIFAQRITSSGVRVGAPIVIISDESGAPAGKMVYNPNTDQYLVTWRNQNVGDLRGRLVNANGTFASEDFLISPLFPASEPAGAAFDPVANRYLVVFGRFMGGAAYGQFLSGDGGLYGGPFTIFAQADTSPQVVFDSVHRVFLVVRFDGTTDNVEVQLLSADGALLGAPLVLASGTAGNGMPYAIVNEDNGGFLVVWVDDRDYAAGRRDVWAQLVGVDTGLRPGDLNCDGVVNFGDINPFVLALGGQNAYEVAFPNCEWLNGDTNGDGTVNFADINPFVALLTRD